MTETKSSSAGTKSADPTPVRPGARFVGPGLLLALAVGLVSWMEVHAWRQVSRLQQAFGEVRPAGFLAGVRLREGIERLNAALLRWRLSGDVAEREAFLRMAREIAEPLTGTEMLTEAERTLAAEAATALETYLQETARWIDEPVRTVRRDTAAEVHREAHVKAVPVLAAAERLAAAQAGAAREFFAGAQEALVSLRRWLVISLALLLVLMAAMATLSYRMLVTPLRARLSATEAAIERQERLAALGTLATGLAHEIRNPLAALKLRLYTLRKALPAETERREDWDVVHGEVRRLERIVKEFLLFAKPSEPVLAEVEVEPLLWDIRTLLGEELRRRNIAVNVPSGEVRTVRADRDQLCQVLINLVQNAADAMARDGEITLSARRGAMRLSGAPEPVVVLDVSDTGPGIPPEIEARMFDPFFSTKDGGTGLGLPIAARILEKHGGCLQYTTRRGAGTVFSVVLPRSTSHESQTTPD